MKRIKQKTATLEHEKLSDGSHVWNIAIRTADGPLVILSMADMTDAMQLAWNINIYDIADISLR